MKHKTFFIMELLGFIFPHVSFAYDFEVNGIYYNKISETEVEVTSYYTGEPYNDEYREITNANMPEVVSRWSSEYTIVRIGDHAFQGCEQLCSVTIPNTVVSIGEGAFRGCVKLNTVNIPDNVTCISDYTFCNCESLPQVELPYNLVTIGNYAFQYCRNLDQINFPYNLTSIGDYAFQYCSLDNLDIEFNRSLSYIGECAFECTGIKSLDLGLRWAEGQECKIGPYAFIDCPNLQYVNLHSMMYVYDGNPFAWCPNLQKCYGLGIVDMIGTGYGSDLTDNCLYKTWETTTGKNYELTCCPGGKESIIWHKNTTKIGAHAFSGSQITNLTIPNIVTVIDDVGLAFSRNYSYSYRKIILPQSLTTMGYEVFGWWDSNLDVYSLKREIIPADYGFINVGLGSLHVPLGSLESYDPSGEYTYWNTHFDRIDDNIILDKEPISIDQVIEKDSIIYYRNFVNDKWQALFVPFSISYDDWSEDFEIASINRFCQSDEDNDGVEESLVLEISTMRNGSTQPNHPYLIRAKEVGEKLLCIHDSNLNKTEEESFVFNDEETTYIFTGTYTGVSGTDMFNEGYYSMGGGALIQAEDATANLGSFRWYLKMTDREGQVMPAPSRIRVMEWNGQTTGVETLSQDNAPARAMSLDGRCVRDMKARGLYIVNGKKVLR